MKTQSVVNVRLVEDKERLLLNFVFSLWFEKELEKINNGTNAKKKKRYAQLDPFNMVVEPPVVFKANYFVTCAADRPGGTLLIDKPVPYLTLETFLEKAKISPNVNENGNFNTSLFEAVKNKEVSLYLLRNLIDSEDNLSEDPIYYLTKIDNTLVPAKAKASDTEVSEDEDNGESTEEDTGEYAVIFDSKDGEIDFDMLVSWIFRDYTFESITLEVAEKGDDNYPTQKPSVDDLSSFTTGTVTVKDSTFKEKQFVFHFIDLKALVDLMSGIEDITIIEVTEPELTQTDPKAEEKTIGKGTVITTSATVKNEDIALAKLVDDLGNNLTDNSELVITDNSNTKVTAEIKVKNFDFAWAFRFGDGKGRRLATATFDLKNQPESTANAVIRTDYSLAAGSITPVVEGFDSTKGMASSLLDLSFIDADNNPIPYAVPQTLGKDYKMFDGDEPVIQFDGTETTLATDEDGAPIPNVLRMKVQLMRYGSVKLTFADPALKQPTYDLIDPWVEYSVKLVSQSYANGQLTLKYDILQNKTVIELDTKSFTQYGEPIITIDSKQYHPTTTWDKQGFTNVYTLGQVPREENLEVSGELSLGGNKIIVNYSDVVPVAPETTVPKNVVISDLVLNGGIIYPGPSKTTENVLNGSIILLSEEYAVLPTDLRLTSLIDALGDDITEKAQTTFTALNPENSQIAVNITLDNYQWPMSFDNQGSNGTLKATFQVKDNADSAKTGETSYKLSYSSGAITPKVISSQLTNNSINNAKIFVQFNDQDGDMITRGLEQSISINPPLFSNGDLTYIGDKITYGEDDEQRVGAFIPVNFKSFGDFTLSFADTSFASVRSSVADPAGTYKMRYYNEQFDDNGDFTVSLALYRNNQLITMNDGKSINDSISVAIDGQPATITKLFWDTAPAISTTLVVHMALPEGTDKSNFEVEITGQWYIGTNNVKVDINYSGNHAEV